MKSVDSGCSPPSAELAKGGGALRATTKAGVAGNRLATIGAEFPFRPCEQARGRKGNSRQPFGFPGPPDTKPRLRRDTKTTASRSARKKKYLVFPSFEFAFLSLVINWSLCQYSVSCRPKAVFVSPQSGVSCPSSDGTRRVADGWRRRREAQPHGRRRPRREPAKPVHRADGFRGRAVAPSPAPFAGERWRCAAFGSVAATAGRSRRS